ncbi:unnamed protein product, partial [Polarella glacialis]
SCSLPVVVVGSGAAGLVAALAASSAGAKEVLILEKASAEDASEGPSLAETSNTWRSSGLIPAAGTALQLQAGIKDDSPKLLAKDILQANGGCDGERVCQLAGAATSTVDWLARVLPKGALTCKADFLYPGHSRLRMHGPPEGYGRRLHQDLLAAALAVPGVRIERGISVTGLWLEEEPSLQQQQPQQQQQHQQQSEPSSGTAPQLSSCRRAVRGLLLEGGGKLEAAAVVLATNGFGGNKSMVLEHLGATVADSLYLGSPLNTGDGIAWGLAVGAGVAHMGAYQGHASVVEPDGPLVTWGVVVNGGVFVDLQGRRFGNELKGYSAFAEDVMALPGAEAVEVFTHSCFEACRSTRFEEVLEAGKVQTFQTLADLCRAHGLPAFALAETLRELHLSAGGIDQFGRDWSNSNAWHSEGTEASFFSNGPLHTVRVRAALFHTQGGLLTDSTGRVLLPDGKSPVAAGFFAAGGTAAGLSGDGAAGYLSGNGLLHAVVSGRLCGQGAAAARRALSRPRL